MMGRCSNKQMDRLVDWGHRRDRTERREEREEKGGRGVNDKERREVEGQDLHSFVSTARTLVSCS